MDDDDDDKGIFRLLGLYHQIMTYVQGVRRHMTTWISRYGSQVPRLMDEIVMLFHRTCRPMFLGEVSTYIAKNIDLTEELIEELIVQGKIRRATPEEILKLGGRSDSIVLALVGCVSPRMAHRP